jgi:endo-1,4-beta-xylanase
MVSFYSVLLSLSTAVGVLASPLDRIHSRSGTPSSSGTNGGYYYMFWTAGTADVVYTNGDGGSYTVDWDGSGDFVAGKGWNPGSAQ